MVVVSCPSASLIVVLLTARDSGPELGSLRFWKSVGGCVIGGMMALQAVAASGVHYEFPPPTSSCIPPDL